MKKLIFLFCGIALLSSSSAYAETTSDTQALLNYARALTTTARLHTNDCPKLARALLETHLEHKSFLDRIPYSSERATESESVKLMQAAEELGKLSAACYDNPDVANVFTSLMEGLNNDIF